MLTQARDQRKATRELLAAGTNPAAARDQKKQIANAVVANTFEKIAREWHGNRLSRTVKPKDKA